MPHARYRTPVLRSLALAAALAPPVRCAAAGEAGAAFLRFPAGPRAVAMGETGAAAADDAHAAYWNPAGLALVEFPELAATYNRALAETNHQYLSLAWPLRYGSTLDLNLTRLGMSAFDSFDAAGARTGSVDAEDRAVGAAYGRALRTDAAGRPALSAGAGLKWVSSRLGPAAARTFGLDAGLLWVRRPRETRQWRLGFAATNLGPGLKFDAEEAPLPALWRLGAAWEERRRDDSWTLSVDHARGADEPGLTAFGAEYELWRMLALRLGFRTGQDVGSGFRAGVGFRLKRVSVDYAYAGFGELGVMQRMGLTMRLGGSAKSAPPESVDRYRREERENRRFVEEAMALWKDAASDPGRAASKLEGHARLARLAALGKALDLGNRPERVKAFQEDTEQARLGGAAVSAYLDDRARTALLLAQAAHGTDRDKEAFAALMAAVAALTYQKPAPDEFFPLAGLVEVKLGKALSAFKAGRYSEAGEACREALLLKPDSASAHERLGSVYFAMGLQDKAEAEWREALRLDPGNRALSDFLRRLGGRPPAPGGRNPSAGGKP